jgi:hypothetical protein
MNLISFYLAIVLFHYIVPHRTLMDLPKILSPAKRLPVYSQIEAALARILALAFAASLPCTAWTQDANNLIKDPSFEGTEQALDGSKPWAGTVRGSVNGQHKGVTFDIVEGKAQEGTRAARIEVQPGTHIETLAEWWQLVPVQPGARYYFSIYAKEELQSGWMSSVIEERLRDRSYPDYGTAHEMHYTAKVQKSDETKEGYRLFETTFETGPETYFVNVSLTIHPTSASEAGGTVLFDNASLIER